MNNNISPRITPNLGKKPKLGELKSNVTQVLLRNNVTEQLVLGSKMRHIKIEHRRAVRLLDSEKKVFVNRQSMKQEFLRKRGVTHICLLPDLQTDGGTDTKLKASTQNNTRRHRAEDIIHSNAEDNKPVIFKIQDQFCLPDMKPITLMPRTAPSGILGRPLSLDNRLPAYIDTSLGVRQHTFAGVPSIKISKTYVTSDHKKSSVLDPRFANLEKSLIAPDKNDESPLEIKERTPSPTAPNVGKWASILVPEDLRVASSHSLAKYSDSLKNEEG